MIHQQPFYHKHIKNIIVAFGDLFTGIKIVRENEAKTKSQTIDVPLSFTPKEKWIRRVDEDPTLENQTYVTVPRMGFEITGYEYDASRKTNRMAQVICNDSTGATRKSLRSPVPYNIHISFYILTKTYEDALQIIEQIMPYFAPEYTLHVKTVPELNVVQDIPVVLENISLSDDYDGEFEKRRLVTHTLNFTLKTSFFGGTSSQGIIKDVVVNVTDNGKLIYHAHGEIPGEELTVDTWLQEF